jgi:hypothetical protein
MSMMPFSEPGSSDESSAGPSYPLLGIEGVSLIMENATTLTEKYRQLCYWRQVVNAENN